ncbi:MAG: hypothetical protein ABI347_09800 [Nitrososphaera sp.]|jgi:hypothetical protein
MMALALLVAAATVTATGLQGASAQQAYTPDSLFVALFANGDSLIEYDVLIANPAAKSITIQLFGSNVNDVIVTDYEDKILAFQAGSRPGEIVLTPDGATGARISYTTPDLVGKEKNVWTFSINSPISFSVKMPPDSLVIDWGDATPAAIQVGDQTLLTFKPGAKNISYVIGFLGTGEQANITIKMAQTTIRQTLTTYPDIVLTGPNQLLEKANAAKAEAKFADAEKFAAQANDMVRSVISDYTGAKQAIADANTKIEEAAGQGRDVGKARDLLAQSRVKFAAGDYAQATATAGQATAAIDEAPQFPFMYLGIGAGAAAAGVAGILVLRRRKVPVSYQDEIPKVQEVQQVQQKEDEDEERRQQQYQQNEEEGEAPQEEGTAPSGAPVLDSTLPRVAEPLSGRPESQTDRSLLVRIVIRIFEEKPHLRQEDKDVLQFLAEKEGAAFESEVRSRFQLPKTTVWRLVKRLEREELVEIRKAGGQNLIKLRFEGRQP